MRSKAETQSEEEEKTVRDIRRAPSSVTRLFCRLQCYRIQTPHTSRILK
jgi:hypothetical protein